MGNYHVYIEEYGVHCSPVKNRSRCRHGLKARSDFWKWFRPTLLAVL